MALIILYESVMLRRKLDTLFDIFHISESSSLAPI